MNIKELVFWEKYRPKTTKSMILLPRIEKLLDKNINSNMIFYGTSGVGKTTLARIIAKENDSLVLKGKLGIDVLSDKIEKHFRALNFGVKDMSKLIVIDEFDTASSTLQEALKSFMEDYPYARFIFTTNHIEKIEDNLRSRFVDVPFDPIDSSEREFFFSKQVNFLRAIAKKEEFELYKEVEPFEKIVQKKFPDLRASVELLHIMILTGESSILSVNANSNQDELFNFVMDGNSNPLYNYDYVMNNFFVNFDDAFKYLSRPFFEYLKQYHRELLISKGGKILEIQKEYNSEYNNTLDPLLHLINYILSLKVVING